MTAASPMSDERLAEAGRLIERAHTEIGAICKDGPSRRWRMSIPAQPDRDSDLILSAGLKAGEDALAEVARLRGDLRELNVLRRDMAAVQAERDAALAGEPEPVRLRAEVERLRAEITQLHAEHHLTPTQRHVLAAVRTSIRDHGRPPTMQEIADTVGLNAACNAWHHLRALERAGFLRRARSKARGIELIQEPSRV